VRNNAAHGKDAAKADIAGLDQGLTAAEDAVDALARSMVLLTNPAKAADQALGGVQVSLDHLDEVLANPREWDTLPDAIAAATQAAAEFGAALTGMFDQLRAVTEQSEQRRLSLGLEIAALRGSTDTSNLFNKALADTQARFLAADSATGKLTQIDRLIDLERQKAEASIAQIQQFGALAQSVQQQLFGIRFGQAQAGGDASGVAFLERAFSDALQKFRTTTGDERVTAGGRVQELIQQLLDQGSSVLGPGSSRFEALQQKSIDALQEIAGVVGTGDTQAEDIKAIREALAGRLETLGQISQDLLKDQGDALRKELGDRFTPAEIEKALADPTFEAILVSKAQKEILDKIQENTLDMRIALEESLNKEQRANYDKRTGNPADARTSASGGNSTGTTTVGPAGVAPVTINVTITGDTGLLPDVITDAVTRGLKRAGYNPAVAA
jgi:hypothetical protein